MSPPASRDPPFPLAPGGAVAPFVCSAVGAAAYSETEYRAQPTTFKRLRKFPRPAGGSGSLANGLGSVGRCRGCLVPGGVAQQACDEGVPSRLVARAQPAPGIAVEEFIEEQVTAPMRIVEVRGAAIRRAASGRVGEE